MKLAATQIEPTNYDLTTYLVCLHFPQRTNATEQNVGKFALKLPM